MSLKKYGNLWLVTLKRFKMSFIDTANSLVWYTNKNFIRILVTNNRWAQLRVRIPCHQLRSLLKKIPGFSGIGAYCRWGCCYQHDSWLRNDSPEVTNHNKFLLRHSYVFTCRYSLEFWDAGFSLVNTFTLHSAVAKKWWSHRANRGLRREKKHQETKSKNMSV